MAFEKITGTPNVLSFYYTITELFDLDSLWSMYKLDHIPEDDAEESIIDRLAITEDEKDDIFISMLSDVTLNVFNRFIKYTTGITDAIQFNVDYTPSGGISAKTTYLKIVDHETYNVNYPGIVDDLLNKCIKYKLLTEWFLYKDINDAAAKAQLSYAENLKNLFNHSAQLKKVSFELG